MKEKLKKFLYNLNYRFIMKNIILMESNPDFSDNTRAVFDEMINRGLNEKFKIIWVVKNKKKFNDIHIKNVSFLNRNNKIKFLYYNFISKYIIDCNSYIFKRNINQYRLHLTHGSLLKVPETYCKELGKVDNLIIASDYFKKYAKKIWNVDENVIKVTGLPRNDYILKEDPFFKKMYKKYNKVIVWMPTYRNHSSNNSGIKTGIRFEYGVPCLNNADEIVKLNNLLKTNNSVLILKFHPIEDTSKLENIKLSNILLFDDSIFEKKHLTVYHLLSIADALITDYSSIYYDFLETKRQICLAIPDYQEFSKSFNLIYDKIENGIDGYFAYKYDDIYDFINNVLIENDILYNNREDCLKRFDNFNDSFNSKRVVDLFLEKIGD